MMRNVSYSRMAFQDDFEGTLARLNQDINHAGVDYDTMIGTGLSGALVVPTLARLVHKNFAIFRKPTDSSHGNGSFEGTIGDKWIFVDDFISTGTTLERVLNQMDDVLRVYKINSSILTEPAPHTEFVGAWEYQRHNGFRTRRSLVGAGYRVPESQRGNAVV